MRRWSLTTRFACVSLLAVVLLGAVVGLAVQRVVVTAATSEAARSGKLLGQFVEEGLTPASLTQGLTPDQAAHLDRSTAEVQRHGQLRNVLLYAPGGRVVYDARHEHDGQTMAVGAELAEAYEGNLGSQVEHDGGAEHPEDGSLLEVYVPLRLADADGRRAVLEVYLSYDETAARARRATTLIAVALLVGLSTLWALMWWLSVSVNRRLRRQADLNEHLARHDALTGLPNRRMLSGALADGTALVLLDLDRFKEVNDALGHAFGDALLQQVAGRLSAAARSSDLVARLGGDEFAFLAQGVLDEEQGLALARRVVQAFAEPYLVGDVVLDVEASAGVALAPQHAADFETLLQRADTAMYLAKRGADGVALYDASSDVNSLERLSLLTELRAALTSAAPQLHLLYQPTVDLRTGAAVGVEALLRWQHPTRGVVPPTDFIPLAEHTGLIGPLTQHVLHLALRQCRTWRDTGLDLPVAVNLSARNLLESDLPGRVAQALVDHGVPAELLVLEITETALVEDPERAERVVRGLVDLGVRIAMDDFGTGYSSMVSLTRLPLDCLKVDRSFVADLDTGGPGAVIVTSSIALAHELGLRVVAEGIETPAQLLRLRELGCDVAQGYLLARPLPADQVPRFVLDHSALAVRG
ncbi:MAG: Diguanylate kinase [Frankiales bacterium]|nr:Diguanylate kinase [Frankiales bacterium]